MSDLDIIQWCDFVRGVLDPETDARMREQLNAGNAKTRKMVLLLNRVAAVGQSDAEMAIPEYALRSVKAIGSLQRPRAVEASEKSLLRFLPFEIIFDSLGLPAPAGARFVQASHRQLTFKAEDFMVDVRLEHENGPNGTVIVGQLLLQADDEARPVSGIPVLVLSDDQIVGRSLTSRFGEFQAEGLPRAPLSLSLLVSNEECIDVPLGGTSE
jgi:hypothetical protein